MKKTSLALLSALLMVSSCSSGNTTGTGGAGGGGEGGQGGEGPPPTGPITGAVARYEYAIDTTTRHAHTLLYVGVVKGGDCYSLALQEPPVGDVLWNDAVASSATFDGQTLTVCGAPVRAGDPIYIEVDVDIQLKTYLGLDVGYSVSKDLAGGDFTYLLSWFDGCGHFSPCDPQPDRLANYRFDIKHPSGTVALAPGRLIQETKTSYALDLSSAPTYSAFGVATDPLWVRSPFVTSAGVDLVFYEVPGGQIQSSLDPASVHTFFSWITALLGPYPYGNELRFAGAPTTWLGFEHPANVILYEHLPSLADPYVDASMHVLMHEVVHQWAGDQTTIKSVQDFVWKEATAEYLAYVFEDEHRPPGEALATRSYWTSVALLSQHYPRPMDMPPPALDDFYGDVYGPGPVVLYLQLESLFGRAKVLSAIQKFLENTGGRDVEHDLKGQLEAATGKDLTSYFDAWVLGSGVPEWPTFQITTSQVGDQVTVTLTQQNASKKVYPCKVEVMVQGATQSALATVEFSVGSTNAAASTVVTLAEPVMGTTFDPNHRVIGRVMGAPLTLDPTLRVYPL